jgi:pimeloyl-ACP methyl ester carboxylesterase
MYQPITKTAYLPGGLTLPYLDQGEPSSMPIVLLHGLSDSCRSFDTVLAHLPATVRAVVPSQRGHGDASAPESYRLADFAADLEGLMDALALERAILVGHSMGTAVAQRFAMDHPDRVLGLVLVGAFAALARNPDCIAFGETSIALLSDPIDPVFVRAFQESTLARPVPEAFLDRVVSESLKVPARVWKAAWSELIATDLTSDLPRIVAPTLLVWGDRDQMMLYAEQEMLLRSLPAARLVTFTGAGHAPHWEEPERCAALITDFASTVVQADPNTRTRA